MKKILFIFAFGIGLSDSLKAQFKISDIGFATGWGYALNSRSLPEGVYRLLYLQGVLRSQLLPASRQKGIFEAVYLGVEPQYNLVWIDKEQENFELGVQCFLQPTFRLSEHLKAYFIAGIGPHYFSANTISQARGFIFADVMGLGLSVKPNSKNTIFANFRIRHLSNANTRQPNLGINTYNFHIGYIWKM
jgi:hypothetical protein